MHYYYDTLLVYNTYMVMMILLKLCSCKFYEYGMCIHIVNY